MRNSYAVTQAWALCNRENSIDRWEKNEIEYFADGNIASLNMIDVRTEQ